MTNDELGSMLFCNPHIFSGEMSVQIFARRYFIIIFCLIIEVQVLKYRFRMKRLYQVIILQIFSPHMACLFKLA